MKTKNLIFFIVIVSVSFNSSGQEEDKTAKKNKTMYKVEKSENEWKNELSPDEYKILRQCGTEAPGTGKYYNFFEKGTYLCAACGYELFDSKTKYSSGSGWPSFYDIISDSNVVLIEDNSHGMVRTEVRCANCGGHLGHVFRDGPAPTHLRYCINSIALKFESKNKEEERKQ
jgi:peptide-methionine (R)-S-oxide reductase